MPRRPRADPAIYYSRPVGRAYLWRNFATTGKRANEYEVWAPTGRAGRYGVYTFGNFVANGVTNLGRVREGLVAVNTAHGSLTKSGTWATSSFADAYGGGATQSSTAGNYIEGSITGHTLYWRGPLITNGGFGLVAIDGDYTAATRLPAVTQTEVDAGYFAAGDLGKRYIECYANDAFNDEWLPLVEGLSDTAHTVRIDVKGTKRAASSAARVYVSALAGATASAKLGTAGVSMAYTRDVSNLRIGAYSALGVAPEYSPDGFANYQFLGENHLHESQTASAWYVDGVAVTPAADELRSGGEVRLERTTQLTHPSTGATVVADKVCTYRARSGLQGCLALTGTLTWQNAGAVRAGYYGMLHLGVRQYVSTALQQVEFDRVLTGGTLISSFANNNESSLGQVQAMEARAFGTTHSTIALIRAPNLTLNVNAWAKSAPNYLFLQDRSDLTEKIYFARSTATNPETVLVGTVHPFHTEWCVFREGE